MPGGDVSEKALEEMSTVELRAEVERLRKRVADLEREVRDLWRPETRVSRPTKDVGIGGELIG